MEQIIAIGGGGLSRQLLAYILGQASEDSPAVGFVPTASGDNPWKPKGLGGFVVRALARRRSDDTPSPPHRAEARTTNSALATALVGKGHKRGN